MKNVFILSITLLGISALTSCKKYVTEHEENYAHSEISTAEVTVLENEWNGDGDGFEATKSLSILSADVEANGAVMCYWKNGNQYVAMPLTESNGIWVRHLLFQHNSSNITFKSYDDDGASPNPGLYKFKVVVITQAGLDQNPNLDLTNYDAVKDAFKVH